MEHISNATRVKIIECPRDAMQGWRRFIPTCEKIRYLEALLKVGFDCLDFGSFVSHKTIPQMADTLEVLKSLNIRNARSKLLAIVANLRGADEASSQEAVDYLGYPFSISETFQLRNTRRTIADSLELVKSIQALCLSRKKELVLYISMGFGNPYGDPYDKEIVLRWVDKITSLGVRIISLADTVGVAEPDHISDLFSILIPAFKGIDFGAHFHSSPQKWEEKVAAAFDQGCRRFDAAINGIGGCPMAKDELVGNIATENLVSFLDQRQVPTGIDMDSFSHARLLAGQVFV